VSDITSSTCKLKWEPPEDDGGKPITAYLVEKMDKETGRWQKVCHTEPDVTQCGVRGLQEGHEYLFRVKALNDEGESEPLVADAAIKAKDPYSEISEVKRVIRVKAFIRLKNLTLTDMNHHSLAFEGISNSNLPSQPFRTRRKTCATSIGTWTASI